MFSSSTSGDQEITLKQYVENMKKEQSQIYYITGESKTEVETSQFIEK